MAVPYYGDYPEDHAEIRIPFNTFDSNDPSASVTITDLADSDIEVHADGNTTQIATDGASVIINFAGETGSHMVLIDSSVDAAYTTATEYAVKIVGTTIDGATVNAWIGAFSIERAGGALATALLTNTVADGIAAKLVGISLLNEWLGIIAGKQAGDATAITEIKATGAGSGTYDPTTDSTEALRDRGDAAWVTATGFNTTTPDAAGVAPTAVEIRTEMDSNSTELAKIGTIPALDGAGQNIGAAIAKLADDNGGASFDATTDSLEKQYNNTGAAGAGLTSINLPNQTMDIVGDITGNLSGSAGSVSGAVGSVTGAVGSVTAAVTLAADSWDAVAIKTDGVAEVADGVWNEAQSGHTTAGTFGSAFSGHVEGAAEAGTLSTTVMTTDLSEATNDHYIGRTIVWISGVLDGQASDVTDYAGADGRLTYTAVTEAPSATDRFILY